MSFLNPWVYSFKKTIIALRMTLRLHCNIHLVSKRGKKNVSQEKYFPILALPNNYLFDLWYITTHLRGPYIVVNYNVLI